MEMQQNKIVKLGKKEKEFKVKENYVGKFGAGAAWLESDDGFAFAIELNKDGFNTFNADKGATNKPELPFEKYCESFIFHFHKLFKDLFSAVKIGYYKKLQWESAKKTALVAANKGNTILIICRISTKNEGYTIRFSLYCNSSDNINNKASSFEIKSEPSDFKKLKNTSHICYKNEMIGLVEHPLLPFTN